MARVSGALIVHAERPAAFGEREQAAFETLAETTSFAITALENQQLLFADTVVEVTLQSSESEAFFVTLSDRLGCRCTLEGLVPGQEDTVICYLTIEGAVPERVREVVETVDTVDTCRVISRTDEEQLLEACVLTESFFHHLVAAGGSVRSAVADQGQSEVIVNVAPDVNVRDFLETVQARDPKWELAGKQTADRSVESSQQRYHAISERLTDKQLQALHAAYLAGYYEHPRESTAKEVAETLGITDATLHEHLQAAQRKLLEEFFEEIGLA